MGQIRELRRRLGEFDVRREVLVQVDARRQALEACVHCGGHGAGAQGLDAHGAEMLPDQRAENLVAVLEAQISRDAVLCSDGDGAQPASIAKAVEGVPHSFFA